MANDETPYITRSPGDLLTAEDWNDIQVEIKKDIGGRVQDAIEQITSVPNADNADKLENKTSDELSEEILKKVLQQLPLHTGYRRLFKRLKTGEEKVIKHGLGASPLVDVYQLGYFDVVCSEDDEKHKEKVNLFLYHTAEKRIRFTNGGPSESVEIEPTGSTPFRIAFKDLLALYKVQYTDTSTLGDVETEFWDAFFADPNDAFSDDQYCHSPWFDRCCGEKRSVRDLKQRGDWDEMWLKMVTRKTINYPAPQAPELPGESPTPAPTQIQVVHFDFDTLGIKLVGDPLLAPALRDSTIPQDELKVMVLLKV
jgi:hypothetical protein